MYKPIKMQQISIHQNDPDEVNGWEVDENTFDIIPDFIQQE